MIISQGKAIVALLLGALIAFNIYAYFEHEFSELFTVVRIILLAIVLFTLFRRRR